MLEKTLESLLDCKEIQPVHPKGNQPWLLIGRTDAKAETPILWPPDAKNWIIWKDPDSGKDWRQEKGITEDEMVGWHHQLNRYEFGWTPGVGDGHRGLACYSPWGCKESDKTDQLNWIFHYMYVYIQYFTSNDVKSWFIGKDSDAEKDWRQEEMGTTEDEMVGWHHWYNGYEFEQTLGDGEGKGSLACSSSWGHIELDTI